MSGRRDDDSWQRRNGTDAIVAERSGPGWGPSAMSARRCSSRSANEAPGTDSIAISSPSSRAVKASISGPMCSATRFVAATCIRRLLARGVVHRAARLLGQAEDLAGERRQPTAAGGQRDPAAVADEQLVAELLAQRGDGHRHRRLGDLELGRGRLDRARAGRRARRTAVARASSRFGLSDRLGPG